jgi:hypothetical protein
VVGKESKRRADTQTKSVQVSTKELGREERKGKEKKLDY